MHHAISGNNKNAAILHRYGSKQKTLLAMQVNRSA
jgi:hypothetical protein